jgi:aminoglycoside phosphotransferase (APT) family kinase protein
VAAGYHRAHREDPVRTSDPDWERLFPWLERALGGRITSVRRQHRHSGGRPAWFVDLDVDGRALRSYVRGTRDTAFEYTRIYSTEREARLVAELQRAGHPVPAVLAFCPDPPAIAMEYVEGDDNFNEIADSAQRDALARHFMELLARAHALGAERFEAIGFARPQAPEDFALDDLRVWESTYLRAVREPVPLLTFACDWLRRNAPERAPETVLVQGDTGPGNFIYSGSRVRAVTDWELAHLGDPMEDLALIRSRDLYYRFGDLRARFELYAQLAGRPLDLTRIRYYTVKAMAIVPLSLAPVMQNLAPRTEHAEWIAQYVFYLRTTAEALAESLGIALDPYAPPDAPATRFSSLHDILLENLRDEQRPAQPDAFLAARLELAIRLAEHLRRAERFGPAYEAAELDDLGELLGRRPASAAEGQRALERGVRDWGARREEQLVRYFHRHAVREEALMRGALGLAEGRGLSPIA